MAIIQCANGHYYDNEKYRQCPHCSADVPAARHPELEVKALPDEAKWNREFQKSTQAGGDSKTIGLYVKKKGIDPVAGWLICVQGEEFGRDYRLHSGRNFIGRSYKMHISIPDDPQVSRENHCSVVYEPLKGEFLLVAGNGTNTYLNRERLDTALKLKEGDRIQLGDTTLEFIPYCKEGRSW